MLNLFIAVIANAMQTETDDEAEDRARIGQQERLQLLNEIEKLNQKIDKLVKDS